MKMKWFNFVYWNLCTSAFTAVSVMRAIDGSSAIPFLRL